MSGIDLVPFFIADRPQLIDRLSSELQRALGIPVRRREAWFDPELAYDPSRGQYNSTSLLRLLLEDPTGSTERVLAVTSVDLFAPVLTYVFGEAQLNGRAAVVSLHRLRTEAYGLPRDDALLFARLLKESLHELGHTLGLVHCREPRCVMQTSTYAEDIDSKPARFCLPCLEVVRGCPAL